ncbi:hypothetical protein [Methylobacterium organophilum]|uniref:Ribbon-helix-helix protein CopG domain-containing protein n=1 Tax=Methylobacterium organophilum TaxID=410 RepID=A0ABQ4TBS5_METOR|nr:hypothetical protein [Methylobacterium organophilum]GJE29130.1 hypothetical protein LKMONMHP_4009 [Methylobacterium organophilum]
MRPIKLSDTITIRTDAELRSAIEAAAARQAKGTSAFLRDTLRQVLIASSRNASSRNEEARA